MADFYFVLRTASSLDLGGGRVDRAEIIAKYKELGGAARFGPELGPETFAIRLGEEPAAGKAHAPPHSGRVHHYKNGSIYWHKLTGAHAVFGLIRSKYDALGAHRSVFQFPISDEVSTVAGDGKKTTFEGGVIVWRSGTKEAFEVHGGIRAKYMELKGTTGLLGYPITDERGTPDGEGRFNHFDNGSIYWKSSIGAHEVHGLIRSLWASKGWERGDLGYPISDELHDPAGTKDKYSDFENGVIYWKFGTKAAALSSNNSTFSQASINIPTIASANISTIMQNINQDIAESNPSVPVTVSVVEGPVYSGLSAAPELANLRTTDYRWNGKRVINRCHRLYVKLDIDVPDAPNPSVDLDLEVEINVNQARTAVVARVIHFHAHTEVDFPLSIFYSADDLNARLKNAMNRVGATTIQSIPKGFRVLDVKTMVGGNVLVYL